MELNPSLTLKALLDDMVDHSTDEQKVWAFWTHYLRFRIFPEEHWIISQEQTPGGQDPEYRKRSDFKVAYVDSSHEITTLKLAEAKNTEAQFSSSTIAACKRDLADKCGEDIIIGNKEYVWGMVVIGPFARLCKYGVNSQRQGEVTKVVAEFYHPNCPPGFIDIRRDSAAILEEQLRELRSNLPSPRPTT